VLTPESKQEFSIRLATTDAERRAAQALRYDVFVRELGGGGDLVDHESGLERDHFDRYFDHLLVIHNPTRQVVGVYRLLRDDQAVMAGQFYSEGEYDLDCLKSSGRKLLELGRSCLHRDFRGGSAMYHLWGGLARYVEDYKIDILFGVASFHGTDVTRLAKPLSVLHQAHLAPPELRVRALPGHFQPMNLIPPEQLDRRRAMVEMPALIKAYLRLGGYVGEGAYMDHAFNTTDVCLVLDTARMNARQRRLYTGNRTG
jgi:L-ornithine Nalpha-acyltransferase